MMSKQATLKDKVALIAAVTLPFWNIPLIWRIVERHSSQDISLAWCLGVFVCIVAMAPQGLTSKDKIWRLFNMANLFWFSLVTVIVVYYRWIAY
jgi:hypothetical protein